MQTVHVRFEFWPHLILQTKITRSNGHTLEQAPDNDDYTPRIWYERRLALSRFTISSLSEVVLGVDAPLTANRIYTTQNHQLVIQEYLPEVDGDIFECRGLQHSNVFPVKYFVDGIQFKFDQLFIKIKY